MKMTKKNETEFAAFLEEASEHGAGPKYPDSEIMKMELKTVYNITLLHHATFEGQYGPSTVIYFTCGNKEVMKSYLNENEGKDFTRQMQNHFGESDYPIDCRIARDKVESQKNEGRFYNKLIILPPANTKLTAGGA